MRPLHTFPWEPNIRTKLHEHGFHTVGDLEGVSPVQLSKELQISPSDALRVLNTVRGPTTGPDTFESTYSALDILKKEQTTLNIPTASSQLDSLLGGGIPIGKITEFCGSPGIGKTQLGIQLIVNSQLQNQSRHGKAIFIDSEGSFIIERVVQIAQATVDESSPNISVDELLQNIFYFRVHDYIEQMALLYQLETFLQENKEVRLIVVDSIAFPFRQNFSDMAARTRLLNTVAQTFLKYAQEYELAVVFINQMTTKFDQSMDRGSLVPALGESWGHACTNRIILSWVNGVRNARLIKSPYLRQNAISYQITSSGIRDAPVTEEISNAQSRKRQFSTS